MADNELEFVPAREGETGELEELLGTALHFYRMPEWVGMLGFENFREVRVGGRLAAGLGYVPAGQWFGGRVVPSMGITAVGVAPEFRGAGVGSRMLKLMLEEMHREGWALSSLYPATVEYYRRVGYERAGYFIQYELAVDAIDAGDRALTVRPASENDLEVMKALYERRARVSAGVLQRPEWMWTGRPLLPEQREHRMIIERDGQPEGYVVFRQAARTDPLRVSDVCVLTRQAARRVLTVFATFRSMVEMVRWNGGPLDPVLYALQEPGIGTTRERVTRPIVIDWMLRIVDVRKALEARGYPAGLEAEMHFELEDDMLPANSGRVTLTVSGGKGEAREGGEGRIKMHVRDLAAVYTGFATPFEQALFGSVGGPEEDLALAASVFAGPRPWLAEIF
ncbi:MAG TPA: GNAT family N-acetyltransferase [Chloroflexia bacterium]|nr:GNAT family N-acetyltransferase [Chloroflexia bacterium]